MNREEIIHKLGLATKLGMWRGADLIVQGVVTSTVLRPSRKFDRAVVRGTALVASYAIADRLLTTVYEVTEAALKEIDSTLDLLND